MEEKGIIRVTETEQAEITAKGARLFIVVEGQNFICGNAALEKCLEVRRLVEELKSTGLKGNDITVCSVAIRTSNGILTKSSSATYRMRLEISDLALLSQALGIIASQKNCRMDSLEWVFDEQKIEFELSCKAICRAKQKAEAMLEAIGCKVDGIRTCWDNKSKSPDPSIRQDVPAAYEMANFCKQRVAPVDIGTEFRGEKTVAVAVTVDFLVSSKLDKPA